MEGGPSNGGMLYHEVQESKLCAVHCVNTVLQGPFFSEFDLAALAFDLDRKERQMMLEGGTATDDFIRFESEESHNVSMDGDFSIQVLQKAMEVWDLQVIPLDSPVAEPAQIDPELENAFICHLQDHWFSIRKVNGEWYNFNSLYAAPEHLSKFYLSAYLDSLKGSGWSIFLVRGNFPKECPMSTAESFNGFGQWLSPEDAQRITKSCNNTQADPPKAVSQTVSSPYQVFPEEQSLSDLENEELEAAIAASLMTSGPHSAVPEVPCSPINAPPVSEVPCSPICAPPVSEVPCSPIREPATSDEREVPRSPITAPPSNSQTDVSSQADIPSPSPSAETKATKATDDALDS